MTTKPLPPTLREKNRYLVLEVISEGKRFDKKAVQRAIWNSSFAFLGEVGVSKTSLWIIEWDEKKQKGIVKVNKQSIREIRASITLINKIEGQVVIPQVLGISGTIKAARRKWM